MLTYIKRVPVVFLFTLALGLIFRLATNYFAPYEFETYAINNLNSFATIIGINIPDLYSSFTILKILNILVFLALFVSLQRNINNYFDDEGISSLLSISFIAISPFLIFINRNLAIENLLLLMFSIALEFIYANNKATNIGKLVGAIVLLVASIVIKIDSLPIALAIIVIAAMGRKSTSQIAMIGFLLCIVSLYYLKVIALDELFITGDYLRPLSKVKLIAEYLLMPVIFFFLTYQYRFQLRLINKEMQASALLIIASLVPILTGFTYERLYFAAAASSIVMLAFSGGLLKYFYLQSKQYVASIYVLFLFMSAFAVYRIMIVESNYHQTIEMREYLIKNVKGLDRILTDNPNMISALLRESSNRKRVYGMKDNLATTIDPKITINLDNQKYDYIVLTKKLNEDQLEKLRDNYIAKFYKLLFIQPDTQKKKNDSEENVYHVYRLSNYY